jgi:hypothetical protein
LVRTKAPKPTFKPEALPKVTKSAEPGGALVRTKAPKPTFKPEALPKVTKSAEPGGALVSTRKPKPSSKTSSTSQSSAGGTGSNKERYTEIGQEYKNRAQARRTERAQKATQANSGRLATAGAVGAIGAATVTGMGLSQNKKSEKVTPNVYNTMDVPSMDKPTGQIRSRLKVGSRKIGSTFDDAFREAKRKEKEAKRIGDSVPTTFTYGDKKYTTQMAKEQFVCNYLLDEGFASDEKSAQAIANAMSEAWIENIVEGGFPGTPSTPRAGDAGTSGLKMIKTTGGQTGYTNKYSGGEPLPPGTVNKIMSGQLMVKKQSNTDTKTA